MLLSLCGCGGDTEQLLYGQIGRVQNLDPQLVSASADRITVLNIFEGLMRLDENGVPVCGVASDYSKDGLTYTFVLDPSCAWSDGSPLTAEDFQFAFRRAVSSETKAPDFQFISCIKGAKEVHEGASDSVLEVRATNKYTLKITLEYDDENFLYALTQPIAMPCREEFFKSTNGKYGRDGESVLSNGPLYLHSWETEEFKIRLRRNEYYSGDNKSISSAVYLTDNKEVDSLTLLADNDIDFSFIDSTQTDKANENGLVTKSYFDRCHFVVVNTNSALGNSDIRRALFTSIHRNALFNELPSYIKPLSSVIQIGALHKSTPIYEQVAARALYNYQPDEAYNLYLAVTKQAGTIGAQTIIYPEEAEIDSLVSGVAANWQQNLGLFINMSATSSEDVVSRVASGNYAVAIYPVRAGTNNAYELLSYFKSGNPFGFESARYDELVNSLNGINDTAAYIENVAAAQSLLLESNVVFPIASTPTVICTTSAVEKIDYSTANEYIDFSRVVKK